MGTGIWLHDATHSEKENLFEEVNYFFAQFLVFFLGDDFLLKRTAPGTLKFVIRFSITLVENLE